MRNIIKPRRPDTGKWDYGNLLIVAGTSGMAGSAILASRAALRSGAGLVRVATSEKAVPVLQIAVPEAISVDVESALKELDKFDALAVGPGIGRTEESLRILMTILKEYDGPMVLDADALNLAAESEEVRKTISLRKDPLIMTPHEREAERLMKGMGISPYPKERKEICRILSEGFSATVLLKGSGTLVSDPSGKIYVNDTGNPGMATAGSGDVLTGIASALLAQGIDAFESAAAAACLHGRAGDMAAEALGEYSLMAGDIVEFLPKAFMEI